MLGESAVLLGDGVFIEKSGSGQFMRQKSVMLHKNIGDIYIDILKYKLNQTHMKIGWSVSLLKD